MEVSYTYLHSKEVVNVLDGKRLGRGCDVGFRFPENVFLGIVVPGCKGFSFKKGDVFIDVKCIVCVGEDVILVRAENLRCAGKERRKNTPPAPARPVCPPAPPPPFYPASGTPPRGGEARRSFEEYE